MASRRKAPGGIALLSEAYGDEDDEIEDMDEDEDNDSIEGGKASPEAQDGEVAPTGRVKEIQNSDGESREKGSPGVERLPTLSTQAPPSQSVDPTDQLPPTSVNNTPDEKETTETVDTDMTSIEEQQEIELLEKFLPPPPEDSCSAKLQERIITFLGLKKTKGRNFNSDLRNRKEYRNPDFLLHAVTYQDIDQIGSCFSKDVFDPHGYDPSDFYDEIEADMKREMERREQEKKKNQKVEFASGGILPGIVVPTPKISMPSPGWTAAAGAGLSVNPATTDIASRDGRQNKKSKWDKVDIDQRTVGGPENLSAALISAAKAGGGYSAFAQQRRKEAEDKKSTERRSDRRSQYMLDRGFAQDTDQPIEEVSFLYNGGV